MFWRVVRKDFSLYVIQDQISFPELQKLNAILDMDEDVEKAYNQYHEGKLKDK